MTTKKRILFVTLSNVGDLVMTTPLLEALHLSYPNHLIDIVADARSSELLRACPYRGEIIHKEKQGGTLGTLKLIKILRAHHYEIVVDLRSVVLSLFLRCAERGFKRRGTSQGDHAVQHHFTALRSILGQDVAIPATRLWLDSAAIASAERMLGTDESTRQLVLAPGANWPGKIWPIDRYAELIEVLGDKFDRIVVVGSGADQSLGETLARSSSVPLTNVAGNTSLLEAAALIARATAFVGNDSGLGHIASAVQTPSLTVFGPGQPPRYRPWGPLAEIVLAPDEDLARLGALKVADALSDHLNSLNLERRN